MLPPGLSHRFQIRLPDVQVTALRVQIVALAGGTEDSRFFVQGSGSGYGDVGFRVFEFRILELGLGFHSRLCEN